MDRLEKVPPCRIIKAAPPKIEFQGVPMMIDGMPVVVVVKKEVQREKR